MSAQNAWNADRDGPVNPATFRQALGRFGSGVTVVSTANGEAYHAMTANAFMSISLDPPLVAISVARKARMHAYLSVGSRIGISVLSEFQQALGLHFGGRPDPQLVPRVDWEDGVPVMAGSAAAFAAQVQNIHDGGDHQIFVGQLLHLHWREVEPLLFWGGKFGEFKARQAAPNDFLPPVPDFWC